MFWIRAFTIILFQICLKIGGIDLTDWVWWPITILFICYGIFGDIQVKE